MIWNYLDTDLVTSFEHIRHMLVLDSKDRVIHTYTHQQLEYSLYYLVFLQIGIKFKTQRRVWENSHVIKFSGEDIISELDGHGIQVLDNQQILSRWFAHWFFVAFQHQIAFTFSSQIMEGKESNDDDDDDPFWPSY